MNWAAFAAVSRRSPHPWEALAAKDRRRSNDHGSHRDGRPTMQERYEIRVRGYLGPLLRTAVGNLRYRTLPYQSTIGCRLSDAELEHLMNRLDESGVEVVCVSLVPAESSVTDGVPAPDRQQDQAEHRLTRR
jgi:hypothetical protein